MIPRPERIQQLTHIAHRPCSSSAHRNTAPRSGRKATLARDATLARKATFARDAILFVPVVALLMVWAVRTTPLGSPVPETATVAAHTVTPECVSAEDMARRYGWEGDWREYMMEVKELNGWDRWPILHIGDPVIVPDYRSHEEVAYGSVAGPAQQIQSIEASYPADAADDPAAAGSTYQNSSAADSRNQQLDRSESLRPSTGRPVGADILPASPPIAERQLRGRRQGRAARTIFHGGNHDSTIAATSNSATDR